jgi:hypothetical protein
LKSRELTLDSNELSNGLVSRKPKKQPPTLLSLAKAGNLAELNTLLYGAEAGSKESSSGESKRRVSVNSKEQHSSGRTAAASAAAAAAAAATAAAAVAGAAVSATNKESSVRTLGNRPLLQSSGTGLQVQERTVKAGIDVNMRYVCS